jgi:hypothetical protein
MSNSAEIYNGFEIRLLIVGPPPFTATIRRLNSRVYERESVQSDTVEGLRVAARARVDKIIEVASQIRTRR